MAGHYITIVGADHYFGMKVFKIGQVIQLKKDYDNLYDEEAIEAQIDMVGKVGYVANSYQTIAKGTRSAGRIYDTFEDQCQCQVSFIVDDKIIAKLIEPPLMGE
ncbi:MAG: DNA-binding protein [Bacillus sp. (in: firmicutes)]